jgi:hypothetical protein
MPEVEPSEQPGSVPHTTRTRSGKSVVCSRKFDNFCEILQTLKCTTTPYNRSVPTVQRSVQRSVHRSNRSVQTVQRSVYRSNRSVQTVHRSVHRSNRSVQTFQRSTGVVVHFRVCTCNFCVQ